MRRFICLALLAACFACAGKKNPAGTLAVNQSADSGNQLFTTHCSSCHALDNEGIGPRLGGVTTVLDNAALKAFIRNPAAVVKSGNARAVSLARRYKMIMPPFDFLKEEEIDAIANYISTESKVRNLAPLAVATENATQTIQRLARPVTKSGLTIELEDYVQIPSSSDNKPATRLANMRPHPSGDGTLFVSDQRGIIYRIHDGKAAPFFNINRLVENFVTEPGLGTGIGSFAFHPDYEHNGLMYVTHTEKVTGKKADFEYADSIRVSLQWVLSEWKINDSRATVFEGSHRELLRINVPNVVHGMQDIEFMPGIGKDDPDYGKLYVGIGDGGSTISKHPELCHKLTSPLGTILRIDPLGNNSKNGHYGVPADNPFVAETAPGSFPEIFALGFRNPHRLSWSGRTLFEAEVGESNFEEINVIVKGGDYGWNAREGDYGISPLDLKNVFKIPSTDPKNYISPFAVYDHMDGSAISGGYVYEGPIQALQHDYIFGDIVSGRLFYVNILPDLADSTVHELSIRYKGQPADLKQITGSARVDVRIEYDRFSREMYIMTKPDGWIRRIARAVKE